MKDMHRLVTKLNRSTIHLVRSSVLDQCVRSIHVLTDLLLVNDVTICTAITLLCYREQIGGQSIFIMVKKCSYLPFNLWNNICMFTPPPRGLPILSKAMFQLKVLSPRSVRHRGMKCLIPTSKPVFPNI